MDHPGFITTRQKRDGTVEALFRGASPSNFNEAKAQLWLPQTPISAIGNRQWAILPPHPAAGSQQKSLPSKPSPTTVT